MGKKNGHGGKKNFAIQGNWQEIPLVETAYLEVDSNDERFFSYDDLVNKVKNAKEMVKKKSYATDEAIPFVIIVIEQKKGSRRIRQSAVRIQVEEIQSPTNLRDLRRPLYICNLYGRKTCLWNLCHEWMVY